MYMDEESHSPSLFGFDLFHLISFQVHTRGFQLALFPSWFWIGVGIFREGLFVEGSIAGRGFITDFWGSGPLPQGTSWLGCYSGDDAHYLRMGRATYILDRKPALDTAAPSA